jgi:caffeoyl-CoA O-methyltransferase
MPTRTATITITIIPHTTRRIGGLEMTPIVDPAIEDYARAHTTTPDPLYARLRAETYAATDRPQMQVGHLEGRTLKLLAQLVGARRVLEIGTFTGYSALCLAEALPEDGVVITCDIDPVNTEIARRAWAGAPWGGKIDLRLGAALDTLRTLTGSFDLVFIDADKENYVAYWEAALPLLRPGGLLLADNVLWSGRVLAPASESDHAIVAFNRHVAADPRVEHVLLTVRDGLMLARKRA